MLHNVERCFETTTLYMYHSITRDCKCNLITRVSVIQAKESIYDYYTIAYGYDGVILVIQCDIACCLYNCILPQIQLFNFTCSSGIVIILYEVVSLLLRYLFHVT